MRSVMGRRSHRMKSGTFQIVVFPWDFLIWLLLAGSIPGPTTKFGANLIEQWSIISGLLRIWRGKLNFSPQAVSRTTHHALFQWSTTNRTKGHHSGFSICGVITQTVSSGWNQHIYGTAQFVLCRRLKLLKTALKELNRKHFSHISERARKAKGSQRATTRPPFGGKEERESGLLSLLLFLDMITLFRHITTSGSIPGIALLIIAWLLWLAKGFDCGHRIGIDRRSLVCFL